MVRVFPSGLKTAKSIPIFKYVRKLVIENYRPILCPKVCEKNMSCYLFQYVNEHDRLYDCLFGFKKGHSTTLSVISFLEKVTKSIYICKIVVGIFLVLKKLSIQ